jgi:parallel beta-helix repeat protein
VRRSAFYAYGAFANVSIQDSIITGDGVADAGVIVGLHDGGSYASVIRCGIAGFRQLGINFALADFGRNDTGGFSLALDNRIYDIDDPTRDNGTDEGGIWSGGHDAAIIGNTIVGATWDGIETVGSSRGVSIVKNKIAGTRTGIYVEHSTDFSMIANNSIRDVRTGINVEWKYQNVGSSDNVFDGNRISNANIGIFVDVGSDRNVLRANEIRGTPTAIVLQGASQNLIAHNYFCGHPRIRVVQQNGQWDNGMTAKPVENRLRDNIFRKNCKSND